jgi:hypothetical protein
MAGGPPSPEERCNPRIDRAQRDRGEGPVSYIAVILLLSVVVIAFLNTGLGGTIAGGIEHAVCQVSDEDCESAPQAGRQPARTTGSADPAAPGANPGTPSGILAAQSRPGAGRFPCVRGQNCGGGGTTGGARTVPPPWADGGTPCWNFECEYVEDPVPLDGYNPTDLPANWDIDSTSHLPSRFDWEEDECLENCGRFVEEIESRMRACRGGVTGFFRGSFNACDRNDMEHELVRDIEEDREEYLDEHPDVRDALAALEAIQAHNGATLTQTRLDHIWQRHGPGTSQPSSEPAGRFADGTTARQLRDMIDQAVRRGTPSPNGGRAGVRFDYDLGRNIGVNIAGNPTSRLRVVVDTAGEVITAFPI